MLTLPDKFVIIGACLGAILLVAIIMACKLAPFCILYKYCPFRAHYLSDDEDDDEKKKRISKQKQMIFYGRQLPPVPGTKATYLDAHHVLTSDPESVASGFSKTSKKGATDPYGATNQSIGYGSGFESMNFSSDYDFRVKRQNNTSTSGSADENANMNRYLELLDGTVDINGCQKSPTTPLGPAPATTAPSAAALQITFSLQYETEMEKFTVYISNVNNLESNLYGASIDSFVRVLLIKDLKQRWRKSSDISFEQLSNPEKFGYELIQEFQTKLVRRNLNPVFNEFFVCQLKEKDKRYASLKLVACSVDKFSQPKIVGHCQINIGKNTFNELKSYTVPLKDYCPELGEILLTLTYLPTSQRLNVNIIKATNLKLPNPYKAINPFVKVLLVQKGKTMEKHTTGVQSGTRNPVFNEQFFFDLPTTEVNKVVLLVSVYHRETSPDQTPTTLAVPSAPATGHQKVHHLTSSDNGSAPPPGGMASGRSMMAVSDYLSPDRTNGWSSCSSDDTHFKSRRSYSACLDRISKAEFAVSIPKCKSTQRLHNGYVCLGRVALGSHAKATSRSHWVEVITNPRKQIAHSHKLQQ